MGFHAFQPFVEGEVSDCLCFSDRGGPIPVLVPDTGERSLKDGTAGGILDGGDAQLDFSERDDAQVQVGSGDGTGPSHNRGGRSRTVVSSATTFVSSR